MFPFRQFIEAQFAFFSSGELVWPAMVLWALDRVIRFGRLAISFFTGSRASKLKFLIQVRKGFTKRLYDADETKTIGTILVDGPYSTPPRLVGYDSILLIAGGTGVSFALPLMLDLIE